MKPPIKLSSIDREHLQELYDAAGIPRDDLPYTPAFDTLVEGFQFRTFKNADHEQVFQAILKHVRSSSIPSSQGAPSDPAGNEHTLSDDQLKQLKAILSRHATGGKVAPYSDDFSQSRNEFNKLIGRELTDAELWRSMMRLQGAKRRPPVRKKTAAAPVRGDDDDDE